LHERVVSLAKVFGGVLIFGRITAADMSARQAQTQVHPRIAHLEALLTAVGSRLDRADLVKV